MNQMNGSLRCRTEGLLRGRKIGWQRERQEEREEGDDLMRWDSDRNTSIKGTVDGDDDDKTAKRRLQGKRPQEQRAELATKARDKSQHANENEVGSEWTEHIRRAMRQEPRGNRACDTHPRRTLNTHSTLATSRKPNQTKHQYGLRTRFFLGLCHFSLT